MSDLLTNIQATANAALPLWDLPDGAVARLINVSENTTFAIDGPNGPVAVLRVHRRGYNSARAIESELEWIEALRKTRRLHTPKAIDGKNGRCLQSFGPKDAPYNMVLFAFAQGDAPDESGDLAPQFEQLGRLAARLHEHSIAWEQPKGFTRLRWGLEDVFGAKAHWGNWRDAPGVSREICETLEKAEAKVTRELSAFGTGSDRFGLIHADMRLANLLVSDTQITVIDFDDCGFGWHLYDFAAAISFFEHEPKVPELRAAWLTGYRQERELPTEHEASLDSLIMLRRLALLAWIGSHIEAPEPQALAPHFATQSAELAERFLMGGLG